MEAATEGEAEVVGEDSSGNEFWGDMEGFWASVLDGADPENKKWYKGADDYWSTQEPTDDGMLGGYGRISGIDLASSWKYVASVCQPAERAAAGSSLAPAERNR